MAIYLDLTLSLVYMSQKIVIFAMAYAVRHLSDVGHWVGHFLYESVYWRFVLDN